MKNKEFKKKKETEAYKECTFEPILISKIKKKSSNSQNNTHLINGLERFFELKDLQEKKLQEKKKIEEKVFHHEKKYDHNKHFLSTNPQPFNLTQKNH